MEYVGKWGMKGAVVFGSIHVEGLREIENPD